MTPETESALQFLLGGDEAMLEAVRATVLEAESKARAEGRREGLEEALKEACAYGSLCAAKSKERADEDNEGGELHWGAKFLAMIQFGKILEQRAKEVGNG